VVFPLFYSASIISSVGQTGLDVERNPRLQNSSITHSISAKPIRSFPPAPMYTLPSPSLKISTPKRTTPQPQKPPRSPQLSARPRDRRSSPRAPADRNSPGSKCRGWRTSRSWHLGYPGSARCRRCLGLRISGRWSSGRGS
jgi:hypothetical protein